MQPGSFCCFVPKKGAVSGWLPFCKQSQRSLFRRINALLKQGAIPTENQDEGSELLDNSDLFHCSQHDEGTDIQSFVFPGAGVCVRPGSIELTKHLLRKEPNVYSTEKAVIIFYGYISNLEDLCMHMGGWSPYASKGSFPQIRNMGGDMDMTMGDMTARVLLHLYLNATEKDPLLMLSELQGHYAFVVYDSEEKNVFAARDASAKESLYYIVDPERGVTLANKPCNLPECDVDERKGIQWLEIPPGYYLFGRNPQLQQYSLTPDQLSSRWSLDLDGEVDQLFSLEGSTDSRKSWNTNLKETLLGHISSTLYESDFHSQTL